MNVFLDQRVGRLVVAKGNDSGNIRMPAMPRIWPLVR
jgi:hypothetical protein